MNLPADTKVLEGPEWRRRRGVSRVATGRSTNGTQATARIRAGNRIRGRLKAESDLVGPEAFEPLQRLVGLLDQGEIDAAHLLDRGKLTIVKRR